jgi:hypothetical protein
MSSVEEMIAVRVSSPQAMRALTTTSRFAEWVAPDVAVVPLTRSASLLPGDRMRLEVLGTIRFDYVVEAVSEREVVFAFQGPWSGRERWAFIADGADTLVRRIYEVSDGSPAATLAWATIGRPLVIAHLKLELARFRAVAERDPGPRAEIEPGAANAAGRGRTSFPIDDG